MLKHKIGNYQEFELLPEYWYKAQIVSNVIKPASTGAGEVLHLELQILEGLFTGTKIKHWLLCSSNKPDLQKFVANNLNGLAVACELPKDTNLIVTPQDTNILNKSVSIYIIQSEYTNNNGRIREFNRIKRIKPFREFDNLIESLKQKKTAPTAPTSSANMGTDEVTSTQYEDDIPF